MDDADKLERAFAEAKRNCEVFLEQYNSVLPVDQCPSCRSKDHCPGLACPDCGFISTPSWAILRDDEFGYVATALNNRKLVLATFYVEDPV